MARRKRKLASEINVVPYIDVMLVLLVVFMVTAPLFSQGYQVQLPAVSAKPIQLNKKQQVVVSVAEDGKYYYAVGGNNKEASLPELRAYLVKLIQEKEEVEVFIKGDTRIAYGRVMELMQAMQQSGIEDVGLVTQPPPK